MSVMRFSRVLNVCHPQLPGATFDGSQPVSKAVMAQKPGVRLPAMIIELLSPLGVAF